MKIITTVMTRNEAHRIGEFCFSYSDSDAILVADGGSEDNTKLLARNFSNVSIRDFTERIELENGYWRNPQWKHLNFLFDWAREYNPDWIIFDDADCRPNMLLRNNYRTILENLPEEYDSVMAVRLYVWGKNQHFPRMSQPGKLGKWEPSLWAWRGNLDIRSVDVPPASEWAINGVHKTDIREMLNWKDIMPPYCLIHYSWDDEKEVQRKLRFYRESGQIPTMKHPLEFAGPLEPLPWWASEKKAWP